MNHIFICILVFFIYLKEKTKSKALFTNNSLHDEHYSASVGLRKLRGPYRYVSGSWFSLGFEKNVLSHLILSYQQQPK